MATSSTIKSAEKIKLLDQMLEDIAGDEFDNEGNFEIGYESGLRHYADDLQLSDIDNIH